MADESAGTLTFALDPLRTSARLVGLRDAHKLREACFVCVNPTCARSSR